MLAKDGKEGRKVRGRLMMKAETIILNE